MQQSKVFVSIVVPAYNAERTLPACIRALREQTYDRQLYEIIIVNDGSSDLTAEIAGRMNCMVIEQPRRGAGVARNSGVIAARGDIVLFTDSDCEPEVDWIERLVAAFDEPGVVGAKGFYKTKQRHQIARFAQIEYEVKYEKLKKERYIDFIDTYSAAYRRDIFIRAGGFDSIYTTASGEDSELSYKLSLMGHRLIAAPAAFVYHRHPDSLVAYLKKKYRNAYWRVVTWEKYPSKIMKDSHTPNSYKREVVLAPLLTLSIMTWIMWHGVAWVTILLGCVFLVNELDFLAIVARRDAQLLCAAPLLLYMRGMVAAVGAGARLFEEAVRKLGKVI